MVNIRDLLVKHFGNDKLNKWEMQNAIMCVKVILDDEILTAEVVIDALYPKKMEEKEND